MTRKLYGVYLQKQVGFAVKLSSCSFFSDTVVKCLAVKHSSAQFASHYRRGSFLAATGRMMTHQRDKI